MAGDKYLTARSVIPVSIKAPVDHVFPLVCPVEEYRWIPGWKCNLIHCPKDRAELGTIFGEIFSAPFLMGSFRGKTIWTVVMHDPESHNIHFGLENGNSSSNYRVELEDNGMGGTEGILDFTFNATNQKGKNLVRKNLAGKICVMLSILNAMLQHYSETNKMLSSSGLQRMILSEKRLSMKDKMFMGLNRLAISNMKDKDRGRFMKKIYGTEK